MIHTKDSRILELTASSSGTKRTDPGEANDSVLTDLFRARMGCGLVSTGSHDEPQRAAPLVSTLPGAGPSLFQVGTYGRPKAALGFDHSPSTSLIHQLGQQAKRFKPASSVPLNNSDAPFPLPSGLFPMTTSSFSAPFPTSSSSNAGCIAGGGKDELLDQSIRSLSAALMVTGRTTGIMTNSQPTLKNKRRPLRNQATRMRLVGQLLGPKGVQRVISVVKELKQLQQQPQDDASGLLQNAVIVDAWENTPLNDLKGLPWEVMLRDAEKKLEAYHASETAAQSS